MHYHYNINKHIIKLKLVATNWTPAIC